MHKGQFFCKACGGIFPTAPDGLKIDAGKTVYDCVVSEECIKIIERDLRNTGGGIMNFPGGVRKKAEGAG